MKVYMQHALLAITKRLKHTLMIIKNIANKVMNFKSNERSTCCMCMDSMYVVCGNF